MNDNEFRDNLHDDINAYGQNGNQTIRDADTGRGAGREDAAGNDAHPICQDGAYGWQSQVIDQSPEKGSGRNGETGDSQNRADTLNRQEHAYTRTGAYAEASAKELSQAAREARKQEKLQRKKAAASGRKSIWRRAAAAVMCGILFGCATAGTFIGVMHLTGYENRIQSALEAAEKAQSVAESLSNNISSGTAVNNITSGSESDVKAVYNRALPSVVAITNSAIYRYNYGFYSYDKEVQGSGSGIIIGKNDTELLIVTNYHVIENTNSLTVTFVDDKSVEAYVKGTAADNDLAVVAVMLEDMDADTKAAITIATLGSEDKVEVGDKVAAIGNALGYGQVLTVGYVSAVDRQVNIDDKTLTLIQTDAAINPGNSGGALLNMQGEVIGINSAKYSDTSVEGMGFAIPVSQVKEIIDDLMTHETLVRVGEDEMGYLGVSVETVSENNVYGIPVGAFVKQISENTPAAESELRQGDVITALNDNKVKSGTELSAILAYYKGGTTVTLTVQRYIDGEYQELQVDVTLGYRKDYVAS